jgi:hypothetical protein
MRAKWGVLIGAIFLTLIVLLGVGFYYIGGVGLVRLYRNYLSKDIADKKFTWQDFTDRGATEKLSGYYGGRVGNSIFVWTLGGLRRFGYQAGRSAYYYMDVCGIIRSQAEAREREPEAVDRNKGVQYNHETFFDPTAFDARAKTGDYVAVVRTTDSPGIVSQLYGSSNQYFPLTQLRTGLCGE